MVSKKKVHKLVLEPENNFVLIGIASHENDYRLCWAINKMFGMELIKVDDLFLIHPKYKIETSYSMYNYMDENTEVNFNLISNKSENGFLIPEIKNIDFILRIAENTSSTVVNEFLQGLKKIDMVITAYLIESLSDKMRNIFQF